MVEKEAPDPAAARGAGSEKEPEPLADVLQDFIHPEQKAKVLFWDDSIPDRDIANIDRDEFVAMEVCKDKVVKPPASFMTRPVFADLAEKKLTALPALPGAGIYYHNSTKQWHASWEGGCKAPSWGPGLRSERQALLLALLALWQRYVFLNSEEEEARSHVQKLQDELEAN